jgi:hypothetical protein
MEPKIVKAEDKKKREIIYEINWDWNAVYAHVIDEDLKEPDQAEKEALKRIGSLKVKTKSLFFNPGEEEKNPLHSIRVDIPFQGTDIDLKMLELAVKYLKLNGVPGSLPLIARALDQDIVSPEMVDFKIKEKVSTLVEKAIDRYNERHSNASTLYYFPDEFQEFFNSMS